MSPQAMNSLYEQLVRISQADIARESKVKMSQMLATNFVRSYLGYGAARAVDATAPKSEGLVYMGP
jgi:hypothetical protein